MSSSNETVISEFCKITGANEGRARFFLDAANGNLAMAVESFYESDQNDFAEEANEMAQAAAAAAEALPTRHEEQKKASQASNKNNQRFFTLNQMTGEEDDHDSHNSSDEEGQAFYAGGSSTSGQQILGPPKKNADKIVGDLFKKAKDHGATVVESSESKPGPSFGVTGGYRLGDGSGPSEVVHEVDRTPKPPKSYILKLWKNGFTVEDGPLRQYNDPQNRQFLAEIQQGIPPRELIQKAGGAEVHMDMEDHREEEFNPPKPAYVLYNETGYKLGNPTPKLASTSSQDDITKNEQRAKSELKTDSSQPTTNIQIRLADGSKLVIQANQSHRVSDIRNYIIRARPEYQARTFTLTTSFPNKELTNDTETLKEGNLLNSVITLKLQ